MLKLFFVSMINDKFRACFTNYNNRLFFYLFRNLNVIEENDRNGRRVFCAKFDRNPKWRRGRNITLPNSTSAPKLLTTNDDTSTVLASQFSSVNNRKYFNDDDDVIYENY